MVAISSKTFLLRNEGISKVYLKVGNGSYNFSSVEASYRYSSIIRSIRYRSIIINNVHWQIRQDEFTCECTDKGLAKKKMGGNYCTPAAL